MYEGKDMCMDSDYFLVGLLDKVTNQLAIGVARIKVKC